MAASGFKEHSQTGLVYAAIVFGYIAFTSKYLSIATVVALAGLIGSLIPDIDSHRSKPRKTLLYFLMIVGTLIGYFSPGFIQFQQDYLHFIPKPNPLYSALMGFLFGYIVQLVADSLLVHRGVTHSVMGAILQGLIITSLITLVINMPNEWIVATFLSATGGVFVHQFTDWSYGVMSERNNNHLLFTLGGNLKENIFLLVVTGILLIFSQIGKPFYDYFLQIGGKPNLWIYLAVINLVLFSVFFLWSLVKRKELGRGVVNMYWFIGCTVIAFMVNFGVNVG